MANILIKQGLEIAVPDFVITTDEARKVDLTNIRETGTTASQAISAGTYFYLNGTLVRSKTSIANGATFTLNTNYEVVTAGALNELMSRISADEFGTVVTLTVNTVYTCPSDGYLSISSGKNAGEYVFILIYGATGDTYVTKILRTVATNSPLFDSMFIKKGMRLYPSAITGSAKFIPLT